MKPLRIAFITTGLLRGGAETVLWQLTSRLPRERFEPVVLSLRQDGPMTKVLEDAGIEVHSPAMNPSRPSPLAWGRLRSLVQKLQPDILQGWMYHGNVAASWAAKSLGNLPVLHSIHNSIYDLRNEKILTALVIRYGARLSASTRGVIYCAESTARQHEAIGYSAERTIVIPNGFDTTRFTPIDGAGDELRHELGVDNRTKLVGLMARFDRHKGHEIFFPMARIVADRDPSVRFVLAGRDISESNHILQNLMRQHHVRERVHLLGERSDMPRIMAGLDVLVSSSTSEAFPMVLGEAMSCGTLCAATDVGDSKVLIDTHGCVVAARDPNALAEAVIELLSYDEQERERRSAAARDHILDRYSLEGMVRRYSQVYEGMTRTEPAEALR